MSLQIDNPTHVKQKPILGRLVRMGNVKGKILVQVDSRTMLFIKKKSKIGEVVKRYSDHMSNPFREVVLKGANHKPVIF
jgi:hypothetical protein